MKIERNRSHTQEYFHRYISFDLTHMHANTNYNQAEEHNPNYTRKLRVTFRYNLYKVSF